MLIYADTSFLISVYVPQEASSRALKWIERHNGAIPFTPLHRLEFRTSIRLLVFRRQMTEPLMKEVFRELESDLDSRFLSHTQIPWTDAFRSADAAGEKTVTTLGARSIDLLHIGIARALKFDQFLTFDARQREAAKAAGFRVDF